MRFFYHYAVVTEGYDDRVIYQEVNKKLLKPKQTGKAIFLNTNGKNSVHRIVNALRKIGIPVAAIYDFDVLKKQKSRKENKTLWELILTTCNIESHKFNRLESERQYIESGIRTLNKQKGKSEDGGYFKHLNPHEIPSELYAKICSLLDELKEYGIFIVPVGEIEHWLKTVPDSDNDFLINMLDKIDKTEPTGDDIWKFINEMDSWLTSPNRKGMKP